LKVTILRKTPVINDFPIIENYLYYSRYGKSLFSDSNENKSVKTLTHVISRVTKHREKSKNSYENEKYFYKWGTCEGDYYFGSRDIHRDSQRLKLDTNAWMEAQPLKDFEKAVIHP
jgi:hypothetical protein